MEKNDVEVNRKVSSQGLSIVLFKKMQNLKQKQITQKEYIKEFYKVNIREGYVEDNPERVATYINGMRYEIQDEMNLLCQSSIEEAYQQSLKAKEKLERKNQEKSRGSFKG